ncbi:MAG: hypothetical protein WCO56_12750 [Verrucomicrobiota bacterium]
MSQHSTHPPTPPLALSRWRKLPLCLMVVGGIGCLAGAWLTPRQFGYSYLTAFMFFLSLTLGALFLVMLQHLFNARWMVPLRRVWEHLACLAPVLGLLFLPILLNVWFASRENAVYPWVYDEFRSDPRQSFKALLLNRAVFGWGALLLFGLWTVLAWSLRRWSLQQDQTGNDGLVTTMRRTSAGGLVLYALSLSAAAVFWMMSLDHHFYSTMYGVYYFAGSVWVTLATSYLLAVMLQAIGPLRPVIRPGTLHDTSVLFFTFTLFYGYIVYSQYFLTWNAAIPEEAHWYVLREQGSWLAVAVALLIGHFFVPFLALLRSGAKTALKVMLPVCGLAWVMHYLDMTYQIKPVLNPDGWTPHWLDLAAFCFIGGTLTHRFIVWFKAHAPYPQRDPRLTAVGESSS